MLLTRLPPSIMRCIVGDATGGSHIMAKLRAVECREFIKAVVEKAEAMRVPVAIAVANAEGHLLALERMDEAGSITPDIAWSKAFTVAAFRSMSPRFPDGLVIQQWFRERNPQLMIAMAVMTNGKVRSEERR